MFALNRVFGAARPAMRAIRLFHVTSVKSASLGKHLVAGDELNKFFIDYLGRPELDSWELRKALTDLGDYDVIPDPKVIEAVLRACRRMNDFALCLRFMEAVKAKCGPKRNRKTIYPYLMQQVEPVLKELGIPTLEEIGYDEPELFIPQPDYWWEKSWYKDYGYEKGVVFN